MIVEFYVYQDRMQLLISVKTCSLKSMIMLILKKQQKISFKQKLSLTETNILDNGDIIIFNNNFNESINNNVILCYNKMRLPLFARTREPGDRLYFSYGHKKLKDFYIDEKFLITSV